MAFAIDPTLAAELVPVAWLVGRWEGAGVVGYPTIESRHFGQELVVSHDGRGFLEWQSRAWLLDAGGTRVKSSAVELGFLRPAPDGEVELLLVHPTGILELYYGPVSPARIELRTDGVMRSPQAKEYSAARRVYGLVDSALMWVMDMAAVGQPLQSHLSAQLKRVG
ncbi:MAG TPA: FABP family protein [Candidatus Lustribacter sp.]|nr:FABP family protein [Candidatus Lustribacter sp.]